MNAKQINTGTVMVDGVVRSLTHVLIIIGDAESRYAPAQLPGCATQYHELAWHGARGEINIIETQIDHSTAQTLFYLLNTRKVSIDTRIRLEFKQSHAS